jgi:cytochrome P450
MWNLTKWQITAVVAALPVLYWLNLYRKVQSNIARLKRYNPNKKLRIFGFYIPMAELFYRFDLTPKWMNPFPPGWRTDPDADVYGEDDVFFTVGPDAITMRVANEQFIHEIIERKADFGKPIHQYKILDVFGRNVVTVEGQEWKKHRKITAPQFSEKNNALVFDVTKKSIVELMGIWRENGFDKKVDVLHDMFQLAMHVISGAAFGVQLKFREDKSTLRKGHKLTFKEALQGLNHFLPVYITLPAWLIRLLPFKVFRDAREGVDEFDRYMKDLYHKANNEDSHENNLLNALVKSAKTDENPLTMRELLGNMFIFLFAGHETTANTLTFALASLALNPTVQERLYQEVQTVLGDGEFTYAKLNQMPYTLVTTTKLGRHV